MCLRGRSGTSAMRSISGSKFRCLFTFCPTVSKRVARARAAYCSTRGRTRISRQRRWWVCTDSVHKAPPSEEFLDAVQRRRHSSARVGDESRLPRSVPVQEEGPPLELLWRPYTGGCGAWPSERGGQLRDLPTPPRVPKARFPLPGSVLACKVLKDHWPELRH